MMLHRARLLSLSIILATGLLLLLLSIPRLAFTAVSLPNAIDPAQTDNKLAADLRQRLDEADSNEPVPIIIHLAARSSLSAASSIGDMPARRAAVVEQLQQTAVASQENLIAQLNAWQKQNAIQSIRPFWIINAVAATAAPGVIPQIAARPDVAAVALDVQHRYFDPLDFSFEATADDQQLTVNNQQLVAVDQLATSISWGVERINAPLVWHGLGIDGAGVTVAIMDSGVDWLHPDLFANYRGNLGDTVDHSGNWYHTSMPAITEPIDLLGHGTHVAGTAVGQNGIGVAPGANWIAVSIADENGFIYDSDVHAGFEWIMAPDGDPALAPDIVNNSWGGAPESVTFVADVAALQAAGIVTVFAAGNSGPEPETIGAPGSYTDTLSVAASDDIDAIAWFSSRGPSPLTAAQNPWISAPGTAILSALPDGKYGTMNGTSMATPHVAGALALLLSANPTLTRLEMADILAETAVPMTLTHPNNDSGWGRLDAYAAVASQTAPGILQGIVQSNGTPLPNVTISVTTTQNAILRFQTDDDGRYQAALQSGQYDIAVAPFGYNPFAASGVAVTAAQTTTLDIALDLLPSGTINGVVRQLGTNEPLTATVTVLNTPITVDTDGNGRYTLTLPADGQYKLRASADGYRLEHAVVLPQQERPTFQEFILEPAPTILLVDGGQWYFASYANFYQDSLLALGHHFDTWTIRNPFEDRPTLDDLTPYDIIIWSNPADSPGYLGLGYTLSNYLDQGGNLLISGQHIGSYDGQGIYIQPWWYDQLQADFMGKTAVTNTLSGAANTHFAGITPTLNAPDSAANQTGPDQSSPLALSASAFLFEDGLSGGLQAGHCQPFRIAYFGFGLEGVSAYDRAAILNGSFDYFASPRLETGLQWEPDAIDDYALAGARLVYTLTIRNLSETMTDTFNLSIADSVWPAELLTDTLTLGACQTSQTVLTIDAPADAPPDFTHEMRVTAVSANDPATAEQFNLRHKIPGHILLVDDDRWYDQQPVYQTMLDEMGLVYDVWDIGGDGQNRGSPTQEMLNAYDFVLWYTAYDWFAPVTNAENEMLTRYLEQGGRLFLTSQDFLYYHHQTPLAADYLGVLEYRESISPTAVYGAGNPILGTDLAGPLPLDFTPYQNHGDGVVPTAVSDPFIWLNRGIPGGTATAGPDWRAIFFGFPLEKLPADAQNEAMNNIVGWLSDLGETTFTVDQRTAPIGEARTYTIALRNLAAAPTNTVRITNTLPVGLQIELASVTGGASYNALSRQLTWSGELGGGAAHQISYRAAPEAGLADGAQVDNRLQIFYGRHQLAFDRVATVWVNAPDLSQSVFTATTDAPSVPQRITYTLHLKNSGRRTAEGATAVIQFSEPLTPTLNAVTVSHGVATLNEDNLLWTGDLAPGAQATVTVALLRDISFERRWLPATAVLNDNQTSAWLIYNQLFVPPFTYYYPLIARSQ